LSSPPLHYSVVAATTTAGVGTDSMETLHFYDENTPALLSDRYAPWAPVAVGGGLRIRRLA
jgi:hypothetical protein